MILKEKEMKISQTYRADFAPQETKSAFRRLMPRLGLTLLACTFVVGVTGRSKRPLRLKVSSESSSQSMVSRLLL